MDELYYDASFKLPFSLIALGSRGSGKSYFFKELLLSPLIDPIPQKIVFVCDTFADEIVEPLQQKYADKIEFTDTLPEYKSLKNTLIVIDDQIVEIQNNVDVLNLFLKGRHINASVLLSQQSYFFQGKNMKTMGNNSDYIVLFQSFRARDQIKILDRQIFGSKSEYLTSAFLDSMNSAKYGHLIIDSKPAQSEQIRIRSNVFENLPQITVYSPKSYKFTYTGK